MPSSAPIPATRAQSRPVPPLPGVDLSEIILNAMSDAPTEIPVVEPDGRVREGVLFITDDEITAPSASNDDPANLKCDKEFEVYRRWSTR
jgi:hypothetical protein